MTSELRPAVETRAEVLDQLLSELQDGNAWDSTISLLADYADLVQDLLKDREAVRAEQAAELAKHKALAETLAGALETAASCLSQCAEGLATQNDMETWAADVAEALRQYKEAHDER